MPDSDKLVGLRITQRTPSFGLDRLCQAETPQVPASVLPHFARDKRPILERVVTLCTNASLL